MTHPMYTLVVDDNKNTRDLYVKTIRREGHFSHGFGGMTDALAHLSNYPVDILFLDNHLGSLHKGREADYGITYVPQIRKIKPWCHIVLASGKAFESDTIAAIVENKIENFIINPPEEEDIRRMLLMVVRAREREQAAVVRTIERLQDTLAKSNGLLGRLKGLFQGQTEGDAGLSVEYVQDTGEEYALTPFEELASVGRGVKETRTVTVDKATEEEFRVEGEWELGVSLSQSLNFLSSGIGTQLKETVKEKLAQSTRQRASVSVARAVEISIDVKEERAGVWTKTVYEVMLFRRHLCRILNACNTCGIEEQLELSCFVAERNVLLTVLLDEYRRVVVDERERVARWGGVYGMLAD